ncbi:peptidoglycan-binding domain-containing protein [Microcoleus sp. herbarium12]|uniref:peptidoglycan-binding domain-containing protein n=1 Tax=Microcoleus sp. herbarium12 TaxID=3055437 RepID=UPI002FCF2EB7
MQTINEIHGQLPLCSSLPTLQLNNNSTANQDVRYLQKSLVKKGYSLAIDGFFGAKTEAAVLDFQNKKKITVDGIVGQQTWNYLGACTPSGC